MLQERREVIKNVKEAEGQINSLMLYLLFLEDEIAKERLVLNGAKQLDEPTETIKVGTMFKYIVENNEKVAKIINEEELPYTLFFRNDGSYLRNDGSYHYVTLNSPLGAAVIGKKEGEAFTYETSFGKMKGVVVKIIDNKYKTR